MFYEYKVTYWNEYEEQEEFDHGLVFGANYGEAAMNVHEDYRPGIINIFLEEWDFGKTVSLDDIKAGFNLT